MRRLVLVLVLIACTGCARRITGPTAESPWQRYARHYAEWMQRVDSGMTEMDFWEQHPEDWPLYNAEVDSIGRTMR